MPDAPKPHTDDVVLERCSTCSAACPVHTDTRAYVDLIARGRYEEAFEKIREFNPFPSVCSLVCHHPCEEACRRQQVDQPVALRNLKRFAAEQALDYRQRLRRKADITESTTIGVVGAGPAGLTVARDCIAQGFAVTVYDALPAPGGLLVGAIPSYRLPRDVLQQDIDDITALGVDVQCGVTVGKDVSLDELRTRHDAVVLAVGLSVSRSLPLDHGDHADVTLALPFLKAVAFGEPVTVRDHVIVVGGGNVAVDVARTAMRLGAQTVKMVCLENEEELPAWEWECREALEEGISIAHRLGPTKVVVDGGQITGLVCRAVERVFDDEGRFAPTYFDDQLTTLDGQMVILAIGQGSDLDLVAGTDVAATDRGRLVFDANTMAASAPGVFACGEVVTGPGAAIEAVASGHRAAKAVTHFLRTGSLTALEDEEVEDLDELSDDVVARVHRVERMAMPTLSAEERRKSFVQFELGYTETDALKEARRCLSCAAGATVDEDKCEACLACLRVCPFGVPSVDNIATMTSDLCQSCGLCAVECPAGAISIRRFAVGDIRSRMAALVESAEQPVDRVEYVCSQDAQCRDDVIERIVAGNGTVVARVPVSCAARVDEVDMMKPFELGAATVVVRQCETCRYRGAMDRLTKRVARTRSILDAAGVGGDHLILE